MYAARILGCKGDGNAGVGSGGGVVAFSAYMGGTRGSGVLSSAGFGLYQFWMNMGKVGYVCVLVAVVWVVLGGGAWGSREGRVFVMSVCVVNLDYLCLWQVQVSVYCDRRIPAHLRCTQCSIIDICFLTCICLWQISQIQTCLRVVFGPGLVSTSPVFMRSIASHPDGRLAPKTVIGPPLLGREGATQFTQGLPDRCDSFTACKLCRLFVMYVRVNCFVVPGSVFRKG